MSGSEKLIEIQQAKAAFRESEEHDRAMTDAATDAIITINSDSTILIVKPATERLFGYSTTEMSGQPLTMLITEYLRHLQKAGITRYLETGRKHIGWAAMRLPAAIDSALKAEDYLLNSPITMKNIEPPPKNTAMATRL